MKRRHRSGPLYDADGFAKIDGYCLYAAIAPDGEKRAFVKVGISEVPLRRVYELHCGSPLAIEGALWTFVGTRKNALSAEKSILYVLREFHTRGEWLVMDLTDKQQKERLHSTLTASVAKACARMPEWHKVTMEDIRSVLDLPGIAMRRKVG